MFGNNAITSTWGSNSNQQQQQPSAFGQPNAFGSTGFGSSTGTSAFGQPSQPQANPMFGNLGGTSTNTGTSGFGSTGAFGSNQANSGVNPMFGGAKPATGFGAFGGGGTTSAFGNTGTTSAFGQPSTSGTSAFGQPANSTTSAFGGGSSIFGQNKTTTAFGSTTSPSTSAPVTTGSSNPPYAVTNDKDPSTNAELRYQAISCMPAYQGTSFEELRYQDYQQGRKTASAGGAFGQSSAFGNTQPAAGSSIFGANNQQNTQTSSVFGRPANQPASGFGAFGQSNTGTSGNSIFGGGNSTFGQPQQQQQQSNPFGAFGQGQQQQQQQQQQQHQQQQQQQQHQHQQHQQQNSVFGGGGTSGTNTFGSNTTNAFGTNTSNAFGQPQQQQQTNAFGQGQQSTTSGFGAFGTNNASKPSIFGQANTTTQPTTNAFSQPSSIFGQNNQQQPQQQQSSSIFGNPSGGSIFGNNNNQQQQQQPGTSMFGNTQNTTNTGGTGLFGGGGTGLFGSNNHQQQQQQQQQQPTNSAFGSSFFGANKPATNTGTGLFGSTFGAQQPANNQTTGLFGNSLSQNNNQQQASTLGGTSMFGAKPPALGTSTSTGQNTGLFGSTFGGSTNNFNASTAAPTQTLTASISQPIGANLPIFSMLPPGPRAVDLEQSTKKKPGFFVDVPTRAPIPRMQLGYTPANSKLRGFGSSTSTAPGGTINLSVNSSALTLSRSQTPTNSIFSGPSSPSLGSGQRKSVKKLILDKKVEPNDLFVKSSGSSLGKVVFSPALSISVREKEVAALTAPPAVAPPAKSPSPPRPPRTPNKFTALQNGAIADGADDGDLQDGDYYVKPDLATLKSAGYDQLTSFNDLVVGRVGYGEIHFLEPVDLTGLPKLGALLGEVIRFEDKECSVYPDSEDVDKPPPGSGLNIRARITLKRCWATGKAHREPIKDESNPIAVKHLKRLKGMKDTYFESFDISDGTWTFTVDHF